MASPSSRNGVSVGRAQPTGGVGSASVTADRYRRVRRWEWPRWRRGERGPAAELAAQPQLNLSNCTITSDPTIVMWEV
jgi:hypothetical protein